MKLNSTIKQVDLTEIHATLYPNTAEYTFFLDLHGTFTKIQHILGHKTDLNKCERKRNHKRYAADQNSIFLEINNKDNSWKTSKDLKIKDTSE